VWQKAVAVGSSLVAAGPSTAAVGSSTAAGRPHVAQPRLRPSAIGHPSVTIERKHM
jgi:hypothetical protein